MRKIIFIVLLMLITNSCLKYDEYIEPKYRELFGLYNLNDTIFFKSNLNDFDTLYVFKKDSTSIKGHGFLIRGATKSLVNEIVHLPHMRKESFIIINKMQRNNRRLEDDYYVGIIYRDFYTDLKDIHIGTSKIDTFYRDPKGFFSKKDTNPVTTLYWKNDFGLLGYEKLDGQIYKVVDSTPLSEVKRSNK